MNELKEKLLGYLIGLYSKIEVINFVDYLIVNEEYIDELNDLGFNSYYNVQNIVHLLKYNDKLILDRNEYYTVRNKIFEKLLNLYFQKRINWQEIHIIVIKSILLEIEFFNLTSNDIPEIYFVLKDDYDLRKEGYNGIVKMPYRLIKFIQHEVSNIL